MGRRIYHQLNVFVHSWKKINGTSHIRKIIAEIATTSASATAGALHILQKPLFLVLNLRKIPKSHLYMLQVHIAFEKIGVSCPQDQLFDFSLHLIEKRDWRKKALGRLYNLSYFFSYFLRYWKCGLNNILPAKHKLRPFICVMYVEFNILYTKYVQYSSFWDGRTDCIDYYCVL